MTLSELIKNLTKNIVGLQIRNILYFPAEKEAMIVGGNETLYIFDLNENIA